MTTALWGERAKAESGAEAIEFLTRRNVSEADALAAVRAVYRSGPNTSKLVHPAGDDSLDYWVTNTGWSTFAMWPVEYSQGT